MTDDRTAARAAQDAIDAERLARKTAAKDRRDAARSLEETREQIKRARGHRGEPEEAEYEDDPAKMTVTERQLLAARGIRPVKAERDDWADDE